MLNEDSLGSFDPSLSSSSTLSEKSGKMVLAAEMLSSPDRLKLRDMLVARSLKLDQAFPLSSGAISNRYLDAKLTTLTSATMPLVGRLFNQRIKECGWSPKAVGGLTLGADPIAFSVARESMEVLGTAINAFIVRKEPKEHGMKRFIEGLEDTETSGLPVVIIDDVCTRGNSTGKAIDRARAAGMKVLGAICLVDREEGASQLLTEKYDCTLASIFKLEELVNYKRSQTTLEPSLVGPG
jgi:orotate phosphoribosyltransferase